MVRYLIMKCFNFFIFNPYRYNPGKKMTLKYYKHFLTL
jgi:hypothetical protein